MIRFYHVVYLYRDILLYILLEMVHSICIIIDLPPSSGRKVAPSKKHPFLQDTQFIWLLHEHSTSQVYISSDNGFLKARMYSFVTLFIVEGSPIRLYDYHRQCFVHSSAKTWVSAIDTRMKSSYNINVIEKHSHGTHVLEILHFWVFDGNTTGRKLTHLF
jgi:hypothetical protein